MEVQVFFRAVS